MIKKIVNKLADIKFVQQYSSGKGTIFMLHRIGNINHNGISEVENLKVSSKFLEKILLELKDMDYDFISIAQVKDRLSNPNNKKRFAVFTFDDGYKDNYLYAYPLFKKYNIPFTIYITNSFPNKTAILWWELLADVITKNGILYIKDKEYVIKTKEQKELVFKDIRKQILTFDKNIVENIKNILPKYNLNFQKYSAKLCISWEELEILRNDKLVTIGSHTMNHLALNTLSKDKIVKEIVESNKELEDKLHITINHFAYPFGNKLTTTKEVINTVKDITVFKSCVTTRIGNLFKDHINYMSGLPRVALTQKYNLKTKMFVIPLLVNRFRKTIIC